MLSTTDWCLYQYRVDFAPNEDRTVVRKGLLRLHKAALGAYIFDGTVLYTSNRLPEVIKGKISSFYDSEPAKSAVRAILISPYFSAVRGLFHKTER